jgi:hypothetical protein
VNVDRGNACWELYGIAGAEDYPSSGMTFTWCGRKHAFSIRSKRSFFYQDRLGRNTGTKASFMFDCFCRTITADEPGAIEWSDWSARSATCPGHPEQNISWTNSPAKQVVTWEIFYPEEQQANHEEAEDVDEEAK